MLAQAGEEYGDYSCTMGGGTAFYLGQSAGGDTR
jgi:hypothetical protein